MIYLDTSVALAHLLAEDTEPPASIWEETLVASRLLEYELWTRLHGRGLAGSHGHLAESLLGRIALLELIPEVLGRVRAAWPLQLRTLDALHLASLSFLRDEGQEVALASYDSRQLEVAAALTIPVYEL